MSKGVFNLKCYYLTHAVLTLKLISNIGGVAWATPGSWTDRNVPCTEDGKTCGGEVNELYHDHGKKIMKFEGEEYVDPSVYLFAEE